MNVGIIGTGHMARELGRLWGTAGHAVCFGSRDTGKAKELAGLVPTGRAGTFAEAAAFGDVLLLAVNNTAVFQVLASLGDLRGKIVVDCSNPFDGDSGLVQAAYRTRSMAERIAGAAPGARVVKAFNTIPAVVLAKRPPRVGSVPTTTFVCGDDPTARAVVAQLARDAHLEPIECGALARASLLEATAALVITLVFGGMGGNITLNLAH